jgi:maltodextrin utilization protein YvdJ
MADTTEAEKLVKSLQQQREALSACNLEQQQAKALQQAGLDNTDKLTGKTRALAGEISNEVTLLYRAKQEADADKMLQTLEAERQELFLTDQEREVSLALRKLEIDKTDELAGKVKKEIDALG